MNVIIAPIRFEETSQNVANLQAALLLLLPALGETHLTIPIDEIEPKRVLSGTNDCIEFLQKKFQIPPVQGLLVDDLMASTINVLLSRLIKLNGKVVDTNGQPLSQQTLIISQYYINHVTELGNSNINDNGDFNFSYIHNREIDKLNKDIYPNLIFKVRGNFGQIGLPFPLTREASSVFIIENGVENIVPRLSDSEESPLVLFTTSHEILIKIIVFTKKFTNFERYVMQLFPLMNQISFADLLEDDNNFQISFLNKKSGIGKNIIESLKNAFIQERKTNIPAWVYFGLFDLPLLISEWGSKTEEEFIKILTLLQPNNVDVDLTAVSQSLISIGNNNLNEVI